MSRRINLFVFFHFLIAFIHFGIRFADNFLNAAPSGIKISVSVGFGVKRENIEYEDLARIARGRNISIEEAQNLIKDGIRD